MLLHWAARQVKLQTGRTPAPLAAMRTAAEYGLRDAAVEGVGATRRMLP